MSSRLRNLALMGVALLTTLLLGVASAFVSALALAATALMMPGTGTPDANVVENYRQNARNWYMQGTACTDDLNCPDQDLVGINYPASFWPLTIFPTWCVPDRCDKWNVSVGTGTDNMISALTPFLDPASTDDVVLFGYSQGGAVVANTLAYLNGLNLPKATRDRLEVVTIGGIENPDGGLWQRLGGWWPSRLLPGVPILDISFDPAMPVDTGIHTTSIGFEYDPVTYAPRYWGNPLALLNAVAAMETVHGYYLSPNGNDESATLPYGYTPETLAPQLNCSTHEANCRYDSYGNTYVMIPATSLPLADLAMSLADSTGTTKLVKPLVDLLEPVAKVLVDLGYDWSGDPGVPARLSLLPFNPNQNWIAVGVKLVVAAVQGAQAFLGDLGVRSDPGSTNKAPLDSAPEPSGTTLSVNTDDNIGDKSGRRDGRHRATKLAADGNTEVVDVDEAQRAVAPGRHRAPGENGADDETVHAAVADNRPGPPAEDASKPDETNAGRQKKVTDSQKPGDDPKGVDDRPAQKSWKHRTRDNAVGGLGSRKSHSQPGAPAPEKPLDKSESEAA